MSIVLRPVADADLPLLERWLSEPHVAEWYHDKDEWLNEFREREGEFAFVRHFIAEERGKPFGFCQYYACRDSGEDWNGYCPTDDAYSIDYLVGEKACLRRGFGKQAVSALIEKIKTHPDAKRIIVRPERANLPSRRLLLSRGFTHDTDKDVFVLLL